MRATAGPNKNPNVSDRWNKLKSPVVIPRSGYTLLDRAHGWMKISPNSLRCLIEHVFVLLNFFGLYLFQISIP
jgi:hypothetical protein